MSVYVTSNILFASDQSSIAETAASLVSAPGAGFKIRVDMVYISSEADNEVSLDDDAGLVWEQYVQGRSGQTSQGGGKGLFDCAENDPLTYTSTVATELFIAVRYSIIPV